jgi:hypothetical protein
MHIQFDRDEQDSMTCFTFDSTQDDQEQMRDLIDWLGGLGIRTSKTTIRAPGGGKMICLLVNNEIRETIIPEVKTTKTAPAAPVKSAPVKEEKQSFSDSESDSGSESEDEPVVPPTAQKKPVVNKPVTKK